MCMLRGAGKAFGLLLLTICFLVTYPLERIRWHTSQLVDKPKIDWVNSRSTFSGLRLGCLDPVHVGRVFKYTNEVSYQAIHDQWDLVGESCFAVDFEDEAVMSFSYKENAATTETKSLTLDGYVIDGPVIDSITYPCRPQAVEVYVSVDFEFDGDLIHPDVNPKIQLVYGSLNSVCELAGALAPQGPVSTLLN